MFVYIVSLDDVVHVFYPDNSTFFFLELGNNAITIKQ